MARGTTLSRLLDMYRSACRLSLNAAHNSQVRETQIRALQTKQAWLWGDFDWPHLQVKRFLALADGQRYYDIATATNENGDVANDFAVDRIVAVDVRYSGTYVPLGPGIDDGHYAAHDSELDGRAWPPQRWKLTEDEQIEIWPIPDQATDADTLEGRIRLTVIRNLAPLIADGDRADLDDNLIVELAAADYLAATGAQDAQLKIDQATRAYTKRKGQLTPRKKHTLFVRPERPVRRPLITHYRPPST